MCCDSWGRKESDMTERLNSTDGYSPWGRKESDMTEVTWLAGRHDQELNYQNMQVAHTSQQQQQKPNNLIKNGQKI